jgi:hypothetical protein
LIYLDAEVVVNEHHGRGEGEDKEAEVHEEMGDGRAALSSTYLSLKEPVLDEVVEAGEPMTCALRRWLS